MRKSKLFYRMISLFSNFIFLNKANLIIEYLLNFYYIRIWVKGKPNGKKWGTIFHYNAYEGLSMHRQLSSENLRIILKGSEFTLNNFFDDYWKMLTVLYHSKTNFMDIYINTTEIMNNTLIDSKEFDIKTKEFTIGNIKDNSKPFDG